ncbi:MAG: aspartate--tRNA ligase [Elusimicrobia bacterium]|nr:aspartate--tRNA ligase [Elusimicrobiota bacterium]
MMRTHYCSDISENDIGKQVTLCGWVQSWRDHGGVLFIDLRDRTGLAQVVVDPTEKQAFDAVQQARSEYVALVRGTVRKRPEGYANAALKTGNVEVGASEFRILNTSKPLPFEVSDTSAISEETRLKYRYLDLRSPRMHRNIALRHLVAQTVRGYFNRNGFLEIETPILTRSTPEGARDYLVPSRVHPGKFYALPQSPQMFKQILMISGMDRYYQLARAFRDEDLRADRQPEHTQIDVEMSFVGEEDIFRTAEGMMAEVFKATGQEPLQTPFPEYDFADVMLRYGSDKPDIRFGLEIRDCAKIFLSSGFKVLAEPAKNGLAVRAMRADGAAAVSRTEMDKLTEFAKTNGAKGLVWLKFKDGKAESPSAKFFTDVELSALRELTGAKDGDAVFIGADKPEIVAAFMGALRKELIARLKLKPSRKWAFLWVKHFPLLEWKPEENRYDAAHNPFTAPLEEDIPLFDTDPGKIRSHQFDLVLNGVELASGSVRNHRREIQEKALNLMKYSKEDAALRFGMLLDALECGAPPHGGFGLGLDRLSALRCGEDSIREVIAFPKTSTATCLMSESPNVVEDKQLKELRLKTL